MTLQQASELSQFTPDTLSKAIKEGKLMASRPCGRELRISVSEFLKFMHQDDHLVAMMMRMGGDEAASAPTQSLVQEAVEQRKAKLNVARFIAIVQELSHLHGYAKLSIGGESVPVKDLDIPMAVEREYGRNPNGVLLTLQNTEKSGMMHVSAGGIAETVASNTDITWGCSSAFHTLGDARSPKEVADEFTKKLGFLTGRVTLKIPVKVEDGKVVRVGMSEEDASFVLGKTKTRKVKVDTTKNPSVTVHSDEPIKLGSLEDGSKPVALVKDINAATDPFLAQFVEET